MLKTAPWRPLTVHDYQELPEGPPHYQLIKGDLLTWPTPNRYHAQIKTNLGSVLLQYLGKKPIGEIYFAPCDVFLTDLDVYQPDILFVSNRRKALLADQGIEGAPDLVVEILSQKTGRLDKGVKKEIYARTGVRELWLVDPEQREAHIYALQQSSTVPRGVYKEKQTFTSPLLPGLRISVSKIFQE